MFRIFLGTILMASATSGLGLQIVMMLTGLGLFAWSFVEMARKGELNV